MSSQSLLKPSWIFRFFLMWILPIFSLAILITVYFFHAYNQFVMHLKNVMHAKQI